MVADRSFDFAVSAGDSAWMRRAGCSATRTTGTAARDETLPAALADAVVQQVYHAGLGVHRALEHLADADAAEAELRSALSHLDMVVSRVRVAARWDGEGAGPRPDDERSGR